MVAIVILYANFKITLSAKYLVVTNLAGWFNAEKIIDVRMLIAQADCYCIITGTWQFRVALCFFDDSTNRRKFCFNTIQKPKYEQPEIATAGLELS
jgi:hypothetical protein